MGRVEGKVAFITGAARGQGRNHAVRLAADGADIIALDMCEQIPTVAAPMATPRDLKETVAQVEALGRRIVASQADVRDFDAVSAALKAGTDELGPVDIVLANAGISVLGAPEPDKAQTFRDVVDVNLVGVWNTIYAAAPQMIERGAGGAIVLTSSTQGLSGRGGNGTAGTAAYCAAKHGVLGLMRSMGYWLGPHNIRINTICPTGTATPMVENDVVAGYFKEHPEDLNRVGNLMPVSLIQPDDLSNAVLYLVSDDARYVTGVALPVDAGYMLM
jgi:SDR family mycofactocin-dependent oxidoreductase